MSVPALAALMKKKAGAKNEVRKFRDAPREKSSKKTLGRKTACVSSTSGRSVRRVHLPLSDASTRPVSFVSETQYSFANGSCAPVGSDAVVFGRARTTMLSLAIFG